VEIEEEYLDTKKQLCEDILNLYDPELEALTRYKILLGLMSEPIPDLLGCYHKLKTKYSHSPTSAKAVAGILVEED